MTLLAGMAFGVLNVLAPLRLAALGGTALLIAGTFLAAAAIEGVLSRWRAAGRSPGHHRADHDLADRGHGSAAPVVRRAVLIAVLIVGMPAFGAMFTPAMTLISKGAHRRGLNQGLVFGLGNLAWASGQAIAAAGSGALAQATSDLVPYVLLAAACLGTLVTIRVRRRQTERPASGGDGPDTNSAAALRRPGSTGDECGARRGGRGARQGRLAGRAGAGAAAIEGSAAPR